MSRLRRGKPAEDEKLKNNDSLSPSHSESDDNRSAKERPKGGFIGILLRITFKISLVLLMIYCAVLLLLYNSYTMRHQMVYLNYLVNPFVNYSDPESRGITNTKNFYIQGQVGRLGVWHVLAKDSSSIDDGKPVVLYLHGNAFSRNAMHRISLYKVLSSLGCHVVAFDYRGFGDSDGSPTEQGLSTDAMTTLNWITENTKNSLIYLWGHSLGTAVAINVADELNKSQTDELITGLILEGAFNNMKDGAIGHPLSNLYRFLPYYENMLQEIVDLFKSDEIITNVSCPILFLHDHDDKIVSITLARKLYEAALKGQGQNQRIEFKEFRGFEHKFICKSKELPSILRAFMKL